MHEGEYWYTNKETVLLLFWSVIENQDLIDTLKSLNRRLLTKLHDSSHWVENGLLGHISPLNQVLYELISLHKVQPNKYVRRLMDTYPYYDTYTQAMRHIHMLWDTYTWDTYPYYETYTHATRHIPILRHIHMLWDAYPYYETHTHTMRHIHVRTFLTMYGFDDFSSFSTSPDKSLLIPSEHIL